MAQRGGGPSRNNSYNFGTSDQRAAEANRTLVEQENDNKWGDLEEQTAMLKSLSFEINNEVKSQNSFLDGMGDNFGSASEMFTSTLAKVSTLISNPSSHHMYYLAGFVVLAFFIIYYMMTRK